MQSKCVSSKVGSAGLEGHMCGACVSPRNVSYLWTHQVHVHQKLTVIYGHMSIGIYTKTMYEVKMSLIIVNSKRLVSNMFWLS